MYLQELQQNVLFCCKLQFTKIFIISIIIVLLSSPLTSVILSVHGEESTDHDYHHHHHDGLSARQQNKQQASVVGAGHGTGIGGGIATDATGVLNNKQNNGIESRSSYAVLSQAMSQAVSNELHSGSGSADGACLIDDLECMGNVNDRLGMEAIRSLHQQLDDDDNGNIDLAESNDFLREELKYDSGYEKRHKSFHYNDDTHISVKELWEAWLRSEVHNWTIEQTSDWLAQSVQLPQYVELFQKHKVSGETLPRLAVNNLHYISNVLGIRDVKHVQKIALKAMDVVLFGPPRETGTKWKDYILISLILSAIFGCWYAYQQNKNAKNHLRRMAKDMEGLQKAENAISEMQKELERARLEQENVATEKLDLERRLKEQPSLSSSCSDLEVQQLKQEIEMLRSELSRAEIELVDHCWTPPPALQTWLQLTYEIESKQTLKKRINAEKQLQIAREACEKLKRKRSSLVGAFVSTHGKNIDDVDRSIVDARTSLAEVTNELQERLHRWKQIELLVGFNIVNNHGIAYLENILYNNRNGGSSSGGGSVGGIGGGGSAKSLKGRMSASQDELDDDSIQGFLDNHLQRGNFRDDSSASDDCEKNSINFIIGGNERLIHTTRYIQQQQQHLQQQQQQQPQQHRSTSSTPPQSPSSTTSDTPTKSSSNHNLVKHNSIDSYSDDIALTYPLMSISHDRITAINRSKKNPLHNRIIIPSASLLTQTPTTLAPTIPAVISVGSGTIINTSATIPIKVTRRSNSNQSIIRSQTIDSGDICTNSTTTSTVATATTTTTTTTTTSLIKSQSNNVITTSTSSSVSMERPELFNQSEQDHQKQQTPEDSTDSSSFDDEYKKRRRKLYFPFGKKSQKIKEN